MLLSSCKKLVEVGLSQNNLEPKVVFADSSSIQAALTGVYARMYNGTAVYSPYAAGITALNTLYADETTGTYAPAYLNNALTTSDNGVASIWSESYSAIAKTNAIIEGVNASTTITSTLRSATIGEASFLRAFCYFYLVNFYGKVPVVTSGNALVNAKLPQSSTEMVYQQIIADLKVAIATLPTSYIRYGGKRYRATQFAATALLSKVYLYTNDYVNAELLASSLINDKTNFALGTDLSKVFLMGSTEAIFQFDCTNNGYPTIALNFTLNPSGNPIFPLTSRFLNAFEPSDLRKTNWIGISNGFSYPAKYRNLPGGTLTEYDAPLRLAEQYLIRAEARAQQNNISGAQADINAIRNRANLANTLANDKASILLAIEQERRVELFCEWANRFFDLKRTGRIDTVLSAAKPGIWKPASALYPIPAIEIANNENLVQNSGY